MEKKTQDNLYSDEISLISAPEHSEYVALNLRKIKEYRQNFQLPVIGIAGTEGKTTTKRMLASILSRQGEVLQTPLDCDSTTQVTSTLLKLTEQFKYAILELGIINKEQFKLAAEIAAPDIGLVTNIGEAHLASLGNKYFIADAKVELIRRLKPDGFAVLNIDDDLVSSMDTLSPTSQVVKFGFNTNAHFYASDLEYLGPEGMKFLVNGYYPFHLPIYSSTSVSNALAAIAVARILGFDFSEIKTGLEENFEMLSGRGNIINLKDVFILDHTYNATVNTVSKAIESLVQFKKFSKNLVLVLGSLEETGELNGRMHANIGYYISAKPIDTIITVGKEAKGVIEGIKRINHNRKLLIHCSEPDSLPDLVLNHLSPKTTLLMTGGRSLGLGEKLRSLVKQLQGTG